MEINNIHFSYVLKKLKMEEYNKEFHKIGVRTLDDFYWLDLTSIIKIVTDSEQLKKILNFKINLKEKIKKEKTKSLKWTYAFPFLLIFAVILFYIFSEIFFDYFENINWNNRAYIAACKEVKPYMKAPETTVFPSIDDPSVHITRLPVEEDSFVKQKYLVESSFTSQNSFGVPIKSYFSATVHGLSFDSWIVIDVNFSE